MATSGSKNFSLTRNDIINAALRKLGEYDKGETPSGDETADASQALNVLINEYAGVHGADIFLRATLTLFIQSGQESYLLGPSGDNVTESYVETTLDGGESSGDTVIAVTDSIGMTAADYIGIKVDDGSVHWTTISSVDSSTQVTIATALDYAAADGNKVYAYTTKAYRPNKLLTVYRRSTSGLDNEISKIGEIEYSRLTDKDSTGAPTVVHYRPSLDNGTLFVWPVGDSDTDKIVMVAHYYPDDFDSAADNAQFPIEWSSALIWGLAAELAPEYGLSEREQIKYFKIASAKLDAALNADIEDASVIFGRADYSE